MIDGGPSVLFDAVAILLTEESANLLAGEAAARDFVADAFSHCKCIGFTTGAGPLQARAPTCRLPHRAEPRTVPANL